MLKRFLKKNNITPSEEDQWWNVKGPMKAMGPMDVNPHPFKHDFRSPLQDLRYIGGNAKYIRIDPAHTYAIEGIGKSFAASCIIVMVKMGVWGAGTVEVRLNSAYATFMEYCSRHKVSTTVDEFSYRTLKLPPGSSLGCTKGQKQAYRTISQTFKIQHAIMFHSEDSWLPGWLGKRVRRSYCGRVAW